MEKSVISTWSKTKYFGWLLIAYIFAHGGILFIPNAVYWDDWTLYKVENQFIYDTFKQAGSMFNITGHMHVILLSIGPWFYKALTFILMFGTSILLESILKKYKMISIDERFLVILFFLVLPFNWARVALINMTYTICYFLFFLAWSLMDRIRILSLILFFLSYNTNSLLVFYLLPFMDFYYRFVEKNISIKSFLTFLLEKIDFLILPFIYFIIKIYVYPPYGLYDGYNEQYSLTSLLLSPLYMFWEWLSQLHLSVGIFFLSLLFFYQFLRDKSIFNNIHFDFYRYNWYLLGFLIFFLGCFPYWILGHIPTFSEWTSRHQLLLPLGAALILTALVKTAERGVRIFFVSVLLSVFLPLNMGIYKDFYVDWQKQKQLVLLFKNNDMLKNSQVVIFNDKTTGINALKRKYRSYEWNGLMTLAFGDEKRLGLGLEEFELMGRGELFRGYFLEGEKFRAGAFRYDSTLQTVYVDIDFYNVSLKKRILAFGQPFLSVSSTVGQPIVLSKDLY